MEAFYDRMAKSVGDIVSPADKAISMAILRFVTCSLRGLIAEELSQLLHGGASALLDMQRSIVDLGGGFVTLDNGGIVSMVHQTAREYLLEGEMEARPLFVDPGDAHAGLFESCLRCLMTPGLRAKLNCSVKIELLDYAATSWSTHLAAARLDGEALPKMIEKFLAGQLVLMWIHVLAASGKLRCLIQTSRHFLKFSSRLKNRSASLRNENSYIFLQELIESWAIDLVKIVGKFGSILRHHPDAIYKLIPPFCPRGSAIYHQFGKVESKMLQVSGLSTETWDDAVARISFGAYAHSISAAGASVAVLSTSGNVLLHDSAVFEEAAASPIRHGERVYRMELNDSATLLATYGYRTVKIWELSSGRCKWTIPSIASRPRPLAMRFLHDSRLFIGTDDRKVWSLGLTEQDPVYELIAELEESELDGHFLNSANYMALSNDGSLIAVAYRGHPLSAWEIDGPTHLAHCWRKRDELARGEVIEAIWHPHEAEVIGLYLEGVVFRWSPYSNDVDEVSTGTSKLALSRAGDLFVTGDVRGKLKVYTTSTFGLVYQLASHDTILGLAFSPDSRHFYDTRGYYGNAWEPIALAKFAEHITLQYQRRQAGRRACVKGLLLR